MQLTKQNIYTCKGDPNLRWGQAIVAAFGLNGDLADQLFYANDDAVETIVQKMIVEFQIPEKDT